MDCLNISTVVLKFSEKHLNNFILNLLFIKQVLKYILTHIEIWHQYLLCHI